MACRHPAGGHQLPPGEAVGSWEDAEAVNRLTSHSSYSAVYRRRGLKTAAQRPVRSLAGSQAQNERSVIINEYVASTEDFFLFHERRAIHVGKKPSEYEKLNMIQEGGSGQRPPSGLKRRMQGTGPRREGSAFASIILKSPTCVSVFSSGCDLLQWSVSHSSFSPSSPSSSRAPGSL